MKLDRNLNQNGRGKYGLILNRELVTLSQDASAPVAAAIRNAIAILETHGILDWGDTVDTEFFVVRLRDYYAPGALHGYAARAWADNREYAEEIAEMGARSGANHPNCKKPD
jgi:enamine deaminase RidA (YjgF/YER057c/UK114 family)